MRWSPLSAALFHPKHFRSCLNNGSNSGVGTDLPGWDSTFVFFISLSSEAPSEGPMTRVENIGLKTATVMWEEIPKSRRMGFINNYTIFCQAEGEKEFCKCVQAEQTQSAPLPR